MANLKMCQSRHPDCFAFEAGRCIALRETYFGERDCPFYKKKEGKKDADERLAELLARAYLLPKA